MIIVCSISPRAEAAAGGLVEVRGGRREHVNQLDDASCVCVYIYIYICI